MFGALFDVGLVNFGFVETQDLWLVVFEELLQFVLFYNRPQSIYVPVPNFKRFCRFGLTGILAFLRKDVCLAESLWLRKSFGHGNTLEANWFVLEGYVFECL